VALTDQKLKDMKEIAFSIHELSLSYREFGKTMEQCAEETKCLKPLIGRPGEAGLKDSWLIRAGITLIAFPDPTITDLVGSLMVTAGVIKHKMRGLTVADVCCEFHDTMKALQELTQNLGH
jgi:hypothetical protein